MINALKTRIRESDRPVGTKRPNLIRLPPEGHVYGLEGKKDPEGVGTSKYLFFLIKKNDFYFLYSHSKLENSPTFPNCPTPSRFYNN